MTQNGYKKLKDIPEEDIKEAALVYAKQFDVEAGLESCKVIPIRPRLTIQERSAIAPLTALPISRWQVMITPSEMSQVRHRVKVIVAYLTGSVCAMQFVPAR